MSHNADRPLIINGKSYPLWQQFIDARAEWIGGELRDDDGSPPTEITDVVLSANGEDSAYFMFVGREFSCGFDVRFGGIRPDPSLVAGLRFYTMAGGFTVTKREVHA